MIRESSYFSSFLVVCLALWSAAAINVRELFQGGDEHAKSLHRIDLAVNAFAAACYSGILAAWSSRNGAAREAMISTVRYVDWMVTVPLLLLVLIRKFGELRSTSAAATILSSACMVACGYLAKHRANGWFCAGVLFYAATFAFLYRAMFARRRAMTATAQARAKEEKEKKKKKKRATTATAVFAATAAVWGLYGAAFLLAPRTRNLAYNLLDLVSKAGFTVVLASPLMIWS